MGYKRPERWAARDWRWAAETIESAIAGRWTVTARCGLCQVELRVNLYLLAAMLGPRASLWNRSIPCKVVGCSGQMAFWAKPPPLQAAFQMKADPMPGAPSSPPPAS